MYYDKIRYDDFTLNSGVKNLVAVEEILMRSVQQLMLYGKMPPKEVLDREKKLITLFCEKYGLEVE